MRISDWSSDVCSSDLVKATVAEVERRNRGPVDVLVNNAGIVISGPVELHDMAATKLAFDTNVFGYQRLARAVLPGMRAKKSRSEEHTSELQSLMRISYAVFCLKKKQH